MLAGRIRRRIRDCSPTHRKIAAGSASQPSRTATRPSVARSPGRARIGRERTRPRMRELPPNGSTAPVAVERLVERSQLVPIASGYGANRSPATAAGGWIPSGANVVDSFNDGTSGVFMTSINLEQRSARSPSFGMGHRPTSTAIHPGTEAPRSPYYPLRRARFRWRSAPRGCAPEAASKSTRAPGASTKGRPRGKPCGSTGGSCSRQEAPNVSVVQPGCWQTSSNPSSGYRDREADVPRSAGLRHTETNSAPEGIGEASRRLGTRAKASADLAATATSRATARKHPNRNPHVLNLLQPVTLVNPGKTGSSSRVAVSSPRCPEASHSLDGVESPCSLARRLRIYDRASRSKDGREAVRFSV